MLQQIEQYHDLSISTNDCFRPVSRYWDRINRPEQLMSAMLNAMRTLTDPADTGAVTFACRRTCRAKHGLPAELLRASRASHRASTARSAASGAGAALIARKRRPLVVCGGGVRYSGAHEALREFVETLHLPFAETRAGKGALVSDHPLNMGGVGVTGGMAANQLRRR